MKLFVIAGAVLAAALPSFAQTGDVFVKGDTDHCYDDVAQVVHRKGHDVVEQKQLNTIRVGGYATMSGDIYFAVQALTEKNKKGEEGCHIYVNVEASGGSITTRGQVANDLSNNQRIAASIAADVAAMQKDRDKKAKEQNKDQDKDKKSSNPQ
jgi:hypothetical protein